MRRLLLLLLFAVPAMAQNRYDGIALGPRGPVAGATIAVCTQPATTSTAPCSTLAGLFTDSTLSIAAVNPLLADSLGNFHFYAAAGFYTVQIYGPGISPPTVLTDQAIPGGIGSVTTVSVTNNASALLTTSVSSPSTTPNITVGLTSAPANDVFGNCTGSAGTPGYCALTGTMLPNPGASSLGGVRSITCTNQFINQINTSGIPQCASVSSSQVSGLPTFGLTKIQTAIIASPCTPPSSNQYDSCNSTVTWPTSFADAVYYTSCTAFGPSYNTGTAASNASNFIYVGSQTASASVIIVQNGRGAASTPSSIFCIGAHP